MVAVLTRLAPGSHRLRAHGVQLVAGFVRVIRLAGLDQLRRHFAITLDAQGLIERALIVTQAEPLHAVQDRLQGGIGGTLAVGILDPQDELAATATRFQPAIQGSSRARSEEHTSELQSLMRISYAVFCLTKKNITHTTTQTLK